MTSPNASVTVAADAVAREPWFIRRDEYPGICAAVAFERPLVLPADGELSRSYRIGVSDSMD
jgi:hypothetical protein